MKGNAVGRVRNEEIDKKEERREISLFYRCPSLGSYDASDII